MDREPKKQLLQLVVDRHQALDRVIAEMRKSVGCDPESPLLDAVWRMEDVLLSVASAHVGDEFNYLNWFVHEAGCGDKGFEAGCTGSMRPIRNVDDLLWLIEGECA